MSIGSPLVAMLALAAYFHHSLLGMERRLGERIDAVATNYDKRVESVEEKVARTTR